MDVYTNLFRRVLLPSWEKLRGRPTVPRWHVLEHSQWRSLDELRALQTAELRRLLAHARSQVPAHERRMAEAGFDPDRVREPEDLEKLPPVKRTDMQLEQADFMARDASGPLVTKSTSGTTGSPFRFSYSYDSEVWRQAIKLRGYAWAGYLPGMRTVHWWGPPASVPTGKQALKIRAERVLRREVFVDCARQSDADLLAAANLLRRIRPQVLVGFTQATVELGRFILRRGLRDWPAMRVVCGAEGLVPADRPILEQAFSEPGGVFETYGCREFMLMASECEAHEGLHHSMENLVVEVVDERGRAAPPGMVGQVAITDLHNVAMPFIRYLTGDLAIASRPGRCPCGRELLRLASVEGRQADLLHGPDGRGIPGIVFNSIIAGLGDQVTQFQAVQRRGGHIDLKIVPGPRFDDTVVDGLMRRLAPYLADVPLAIELVPDIPTTPSGKRRHVVVET